MSAPPIEEWDEVIREFLTGDLDYARFERRYLDLHRRWADDDLLDPYPEDVMSALARLFDLVEAYDDASERHPVTDAELRSAAHVARQEIASAAELKRGPERSTLLVIRSRHVAEQLATAATAEGVATSIEATVTGHWMLRLTGLPDEILARRERLSQQLRELEF